MAKRKAFTADRNGLNIDKFVNDYVNDYGSIRDL